MDDLRVTNEIRAIIKHPARFKVLTTGRRWGKDRAGMIWLHHGELMPDMMYWYVAPYRIQAKEIGWPLVKRLAREYGVGGRAISESELSVTWPNGAQTKLKGADNPDSLLGVGVARVLCTEYARWKPEVWPQIIRPMLTQSKGSAMFNSSPKGYDHHYELHERGMSEADTDWMSWSYKTKDSPFVDPEEVESARKDMDPWLFRQEYEASFESAGNRACYMFDRAKHVRDDIDTRGARIVWGMDFNVEPMLAHMAAVWPDRVHYLDEIHIANNATTSAMLTRMKAHSPGVLDIYPDPTGGARSANSDRSNHQILRDGGLRVICHRQSPDQIDRLNAWNTMLENGVGDVRLTMSAKCRKLIDDCERAQRLPDGRIDKQFRDPHALDSASYMVEYLFPVVRREVLSIGGLR